jgi:hypothetical protein
MSTEDPITQQPQHAKSDMGDVDDTQATKELAERLSVIIEEANERVVPLTRMIRQVSAGNPFHYERRSLMLSFNSTSRSLKLKKKRIATRVPLSNL